jgi:hypothetical protein
MQTPLCYISKFSCNIKKIKKYIWANSHLWSVSKFLFDFLGPNYGLFKKIEPEFGQNFRHDHNQPCTNWS